MGDTTMPSLSGIKRAPLLPIDTGPDPKVIPSDTMLDSDEFLKLLEPLFDGAHLKHVLAVLKRSAVLVFTETALYLRFPNEKVDGKVHRIVRDDLHKDLLGARDKPVYGAYKQQGIITYPPHFETEVNQEQDMIDAGVERMNKFSNFQEYVDYCDSEIQKWLRPVRHLPPSPSQDSQEASDDTNAQRAALGLPPVLPSHRHWDGNPTDCAAASSTRPLPMLQHPPRRPRRRR